MNIELIISVSAFAITLFGFLTGRLIAWKNKKKQIQEEGVEKYQLEVLKKNITAINKNFVKLGTILAKINKDLDSCFNQLRILIDKNKSTEKKWDLIVTEINEIGRSIVDLQVKSELIDKLDEKIQRHIEKD